MEISFFSSHSLTFANSTVFMTANIVLPIPFRLEQFAVDTALLNEQREITYTQMGVDGNLVWGTMHSPSVVTISFLPSSPSITWIDLLIGTQAMMEKVIPVSLIVSSVSLSSTWSFINGVCTRAADMPPGEKIWETRKYEFTFETASALPVGIGF